MGSTGSLAGWGCWALPVHGPGSGADGAGGPHRSDREHPGRRGLLEVASGHVAGARPHATAKAGARHWRVELGPEVHARPPGPRGLHLLPLLPPLHPGGNKRPCVARGALAGNRGVVAEAAAALGGRGELMGTCTATWPGGRCRKPARTVGSKHCAAHGRQVRQGVLLHPLKGSSPSIAELVLCRLRGATYTADGCLIPVGAMEKRKVYPTVKYRGKDASLGRLVLEMHHGACPDGMEMLHKCPGGGDPRCCNIAHLTWGTRKENVQDASRAGRWRRSKGEDSPHAKMAEPDVRDMLILHYQGMPYSDLARMFRVSKSNVASIAQGKSWPHLAGCCGRVATCSH